MTVRWFLLFMFLLAFTLVSLPLSCEILVRSGPDWARHQEDPYRASDGLKGSVALLALLMFFTMVVLVHAADAVEERPKPFWASTPPAPPPPPPPPPTKGPNNGYYEVRIIDQAGAND